MKVKKGILIVFEGIDGSGKSTQVQILRKILEDKGLDVVDFREPSQSPWGKKIKEKAALPDSLSPEEELELFVKDRKHNVLKNLRPALAKNNIVLLDRYYFSTMAYQGAKGLDVETIRQMNENFAIRPDLVFILDVDAGKALRRGDNIFHIDSEKTPEEISKHITSVVFKYIHNDLQVS